MWSNSVQQWLALLAWVSDKLCTPGFEDGAGVHQAAWGPGGKRQDILGIRLREGRVSDNWASPEKGHQEHLWGNG